MKKKSWEKGLEGLGAVVITGGSSGIGEIFINRINSLGKKIPFCNLSRRSPEEKFPSAEIRHVSCDLSDGKGASAGAEAALAFCAEHPRGQLLLINNSGFGSCGFFPEPDLGQNLDMIGVNVAAPLLLTARLLPEMKRRGGWILNVASTAAFQPTPYLAVYGATKAFLLHWSLSLGEELGGTGVRVLALCPGPTATAFFKRAGFEQPVVPETLGQTPEEVVDHALRALVREKKITISGWANRIMAVVSSRLPKTWSASLSGKILRRHRLQRLSRSGAAGAGRGEGR